MSNPNVRTLPTPLGLADFEIGVTLGTGSFGRVRIVTHKVHFRRWEARLRLAKGVLHDPFHTSFSVPRAFLVATTWTHNFISLSSRPDRSFRYPHPPNPSTQSTSSVWALKMLKKAEVIRLQQVEHMVSEKTILAKMDHPFIVRLAGTFQDPKYLYMALEYIVGGVRTYVGQSNARRAGRTAATICSLCRAVSTSSLNSGSPFCNCPSAVASNNKTAGIFHPPPEGRTLRPPRRQVLRVQRHPCLRVHAQLRLHLQRPQARKSFAG